MSRGQLMPAANLAVMLHFIEGLALNTITVKISPIALKTKIIVATKPHHYYSTKCKTYEKKIITLLSSHVVF